MKKIFFLKLIFISSFVYCQSSFNYAGQVSRMVATPNSPEAQSFANYGNIPVNLYVGAPNIAVPLYTFTGRELNLPIGLTYDMNNRKVDDLASNIGLGWNLNLGGRITRMVNGLPDHFFENNSDAEAFDYPTMHGDDNLRTVFNTYKAQLEAYAVGTSFSFDNEPDAKEFFKLLNDIGNSKADLANDKFAINVLGLSETLIMDPENGNEPIPLYNPRIKVTQNNTPNFYSFNNVWMWEIVDANGVTYRFGCPTEGCFEATEKSWRKNLIGGQDGDIFTKYRSSWLIKEIISPNGKDVYTFDYDEIEGYWTTSYKTNNAHFTNIGDNNSTQSYDPNSRFYIDQQFLTSVKHNGNTIVEIELANRDDIPSLPNSKIQSITIKDPFDSSKIINHFEFEQSYFGQINTQNQDPFNNIRLKLDAIKVAGHDYTPNNYNFQKQYSFEYETPELMPSRDDLDFDVLGFYNNKGNGTLKPRAEKDNGGTLTGADRDSDFTFAKIGVLKQINYPTGGHSLFEYGPHLKYYQQGSISTTTINKLMVGNFNTEFEDPNQCGTCCQQESEPNELADVYTETFSFESDPDISYELSFYLDTDKQNPIYDNYRAYVISNDTQVDITYENICNNVLTPSYDFNMFTSNGDTQDETINHDDLTTGDYTLMVVNLDQNTTEGWCGVQGNIPDKYLCSKVHLDVEKTEYYETTLDRELPGIRIESISDYTDGNTIATKKTYTYEGVSANHDPKFYYSQPFCYDIGGNNVPLIGTIHNRVSKPIIGSSPYVTYSKVIEKRVVPNTGVALDGYTVYNFNNEIGDGNYIGSAPDHLAPFGEDFYMNITKGTLSSSEVYDNNDILLAKSENEIIEKPTGNTTYKHFSIKDQPSYNLHYIKLYLSNGMVNVARVNQLSNGDVPTCSGDCLDILTVDANARVIPYVTETHTKYPLLSSSSSTQYLGDKQVTTSSSKLFDASIGYFPRRSVKNADKTYITQYTYPEEAVGIPYTGQLVSANRLASPVKVVTSENTISNVLSTQEIHYNDFDGYILPEKILASKGDEGLENRANFSNYKNGNLVESSKPNDTPTLYVWGYDNQFPVAKIQHNISYTSLEQQNGSLLSQINNATDNATLQTKLQDLRNLPVLNGAFITTYIYKPYIGVHTITDPRGETVTFHYDELNRLKYVVDKDGNRLSEKEYNYRLN